MTLPAVGYFAIRDWVNQGLQRDYWDKLLFVENFLALGSDD